jgi:hypothetical protein
MGTLSRIVFVSDCANVLATTFKPSASSSIDCDWLYGTAALMAATHVSNSRPIPFASSVCSCRYQAMSSTPTVVMFPPKQPNRSTIVTHAPHRAASTAARPAGPEPTTEKSVS